MNIVIDINDSTPLFAQLIEQIKQAIIKGKIQAGDALPSIRQLANDLEINNKTVAKAYRLLERDAIIEGKGYRGTFVRTDAKKNCSVDINHWVKQQLTETIATLRDSGATDSEIRIAFGKAMNKRT